MGNIYYDQGKYAKAAEYYDKSLKLNPNDKVIKENKRKALQRK